MLHLHILAKELNYGLSLVMAAVDKKHARPILANVKLECVGGEVFVSTSNLNLALRVRLNAQVMGDGSATVNAAIFTDIARKFHDTTFEIKVVPQTQSLTIEGDGFKSELTMMDAAEFPSLERLDNPTSITIIAQDLLNILDQVTHTVPTQSLKYNVNGVLLEYYQGALHAVALDGHRLSVAGCSAEALTEFKVIIPRRAISEVTKVCKQNTKELVEVAFDKSTIQVSSGPLMMQSRLNKVTCPDYRAIIPSNYKNCLTIHTNLLASAIDRVSTLACDTNSAVTIALSGSEVKISAYGSMKGSSYATLVDGFTYEGDTLIFGMNPRYLLDVLTVYRNSEVKLYIKNASSAALLKIPSRPLSAFVIMPVNLLKDSSGSGEA